jgi:sulfur-carrier protein adenylyltransferase/sulfurtransferase
MIWSLENPERSRLEREALESLSSTSPWLIAGERRIDEFLRLIWDAEIVVGERKFPISLRYPNHFPHSPPLVLPRGDLERWSSHQWGAGGELCLEYGSDNWQPTITGSDMIQSAYRLLSGENPSPHVTSVVASRHATTLGQDLRGDWFRFLFTREVTEALSVIPAGEMCSADIVATFRAKSAVYVISALESPAGRKWREENLPKTLVDEGIARTAAVFRWPVEADLPPTSSRTAFFAAVSSQGLSMPEVQYAILIKGEAFHPYFLWKDNDRAGSISTIPAQPVLVRLDDDHALLKERKVAIVGCGSLGSKFAVMLARAGVADFLLVDDDVMLPDNVIRHELDWREVGAHKVEGVARRIDLVNSGAKCDCRQYRLGGQQSGGSVETLIETIAGYDLIVDATADPRVFNYLCAAAEVGKKPLLWAEVFGGGFGGLIARHRPNIEPKPAAMRASIEQWCAEQGKPIERAAANYENRESGVPLIADDADVTVIASHAARLAIDTLLGRTPSVFPNSVYMIGLSQGWIFDQPFDTRPIDVGPAPQTETVAVSQELANEERDRLLDLLKKFSDAATANSASPPSPSA